MRKLPLRSLKSSMVCWIKKEHGGIFNALLQGLFGFWGEFDYDWPLIGEMVWEFYWEMVLDENRMGIQKVE